MSIGPQADENKGTQPCFILFVALFGVDRYTRIISTPEIHIKSLFSVIYSLLTSFGLKEPQYAIDFAVHVFHSAISIGVQRRDCIYLDGSDWTGSDPNFNDGSL